MRLFLAAPRRGFPSLLTEVLGGIPEVREERGSGHNKAGANSQNGIIELRPTAWLADVAVRS